VEFKIDSGAEANILPFAVLQKVDRNAVINSTSVKIKAYGGHSIPIKGITSLVCMHRNEISVEDFIVI
jgi:hypothetical protein